jgi:DNA-directed RNA polymerase specialized sigma24 family protein
MTRKLPCKKESWRAAAPGALTRLSPEHREIIDLVYYHERSVDECAAALVTSALVLISAAVP